MNKNEFYKQLMSEYAFDAEKIRENAKRGKKRQKLQPMYIGMSAAAAVSVVTVGTIAAVNLGKNEGVSLTNTGLTTLSASDRLSHALEQLEQERTSAESKNFLVTFSAPMTPAEAQTVLTSEGTIPVKQLYFADGTRMTGSDEIGKVFTQGTRSDITGAAVYCSGETAAVLQSSPEVFLVEILEESDFEIAAPVNMEEIDTVEVTVPDNTNANTDPVIAAPTDTYEPTVPAETTETSESRENDGTAEPDSSTEEMDGTAEPEATTEAVTDEPDDSGLSTSESEVQEPVPPVTTTTTTTTTENTAGSNTDEPSGNEPQEQQNASLPEGVTLPYNVAENIRNTYITGDTAFFLSSDIMFVKDEAGIYLYRSGEDNDELLCSAELTDAKIAWVSENGKRLMISGTGDFGSRSRMLLVDADSELITDLYVEDIVSSGALTSVGYNADSRIMALCIRDQGMYYLCTAELTSDNSLSFIGTQAESSEKLSLAACYGTNVYYTETVDGNTSLYSVDAYTGNAGLVHQFSGAPKLSRNLAFNYAVFAPGEDSVIGFTEIFDPSSGSFIKLVSGDTSVSFGASRNSFLNGGSCWSISDGELTSDGGITALKPIEYRRSGSEQWYAYVQNGTVRVGSSVYTSSNKSSLITFSSITANASAELTDVIKGAIGVNNAIALDACRDSGITKPQTLIDCINLYYSANASQRLMTRCDIQPYGALGYTNGGLTSANVDKTALVISSQTGSTASGVLYIEAGTFGGKTGYRSVNVSFVKENDLWKLDCIL